MLERNISIDLMRLFCASGVIFTHIQAGTLLAKYFQLFFHSFHVFFCYLSAFVLFSFESSFLSYATFGIYLIHICFVEGIEIISEKIYGPLENNLLQNILYSIMVLLFSYWTCLIVNKLNVNRYLLLGNGSKK